MPIEHFVEVFGGERERGAVGFSFHGRFALTLGEEAHFCQSRNSVRTSGLQLGNRLWSDGEFVSWNSGTDLQNMILLEAIEGRHQTECEPFRSVESTFWFPRFLV